MCYVCSLCPLGAVAATDSNCQVVSQKANRDPGACAAGAKSGHSGEEETHIPLMFCHHFLLQIFADYFTLLSSTLKSSSRSSSFCLCNLSFPAFVSFPKSLLLLIIETLECCDGFIDLSFALP